MRQVNNFRAISWTEGLLGAANKGGEVKVFPLSNYLINLPQGWKIRKSSQKWLLLFLINVAVNIISFIRYF